MLYQILHRLLPTAYNTSAIGNSDSSKLGSQCTNNVNHAQTSHEDARMDFGGESSDKNDHESENSISNTPNVVSTLSNFQPETSTTGSSDSYKVGQPINNME